MAPDDILKKYWGYPRLRTTQKTAIQHILDQRDVIALLPTGGGKSICFQVPALLNDGLCIVVSPLISLMQDQVEGLKNRGIKAMMLGGAMGYKELLTQLDNCLYGGYKFLYLSPERLQQQLVQERIQQLNVNLIAIDEAHCISEWGHDFRPAYRNIPLLRDLQPGVPLMALTATATTRVLNDIRENLALENAALVKKSFARENIALLVNKCEDKNYALQKFLKKNEGIAIVYVRSRKLTLSLSRILNNHNISAQAYHGGMTSEIKAQRLKDWQAEKFNVMVATNAFGMGIDKANVRQVIHFHLPDSLESYYQEVGRAGRDGKPAKACLIYNNNDILKLKDQFLKNAPTPQNTKLIYKKLNTYFSIAYGEGQDTQHNFKFLDFCHTYGINTYLAYNVLQFLDRLDVLSLSKEFHQRTALFFKISNRELLGFLKRQPQFEKLVHTLLRMKGGFFEFKTTVDIRILQKKTGLNRLQINALLKKLDALEVIELTLADQDSTVEFIVPREDDKTINPLVPYITQYYKNKKHKIDEVVNFIEDDQTCRLIRLLAYFDEERNEDCGQCSVCQNRKNTTPGSRQNLEHIHKAIINMLSEKERTSKQLILRLSYPEKNLLFVLKRMLDTGEIKRTTKNTYILIK